MNSTYRDDGTLGATRRLRSGQASGSEAGLNLLGSSESCS
jgi:hypothetical protein